MASAVSLSRFFVFNVHVLPHVLHWSLGFCVLMVSLAFLNLPFLSRVKANCSMSWSICWSCPSFTCTSETVFRCCFWAVSFADASIASAKAHSCMWKRRLRDDLRIL